MRPILLIAVLAASLATAPTRPAWARDAAASRTNVALCVAPDRQTNPAMIPDGQGGAIVAWQDHRSGRNWDIYAQHVLAGGALDPAFGGREGMLICTAANDRANPAIASDGAGGAIVTWQDNRGGADLDIYAQHVTAKGVLDPRWGGLNALAVCAGPKHQTDPTIVSDGAGGAIITWQDDRVGSTWDIYAQHVLANGTLDRSWGGPAGLALCTAANAQLKPQIIADGAGGAIVAWEDNRSRSWDIYAQHVLANGTLDPGWGGLEGLAICDAVNNQFRPRLVTDAAGGAIIAWFDGRSGNYDIYAQHVLANGALDPGWGGPSARALCTAPDAQVDPAIAADGAGGAIVAWSDSRGGTPIPSAEAWDICHCADPMIQQITKGFVLDQAGRKSEHATCQMPSMMEMADDAPAQGADSKAPGPDIYAQHVLADGTLDPSWQGENGIAVSAAPNSQLEPKVIADGAGGAIVAWEDRRGGTRSHIVAQRVNAAGTLDPAWGGDGVELSSAPGDQSNLALVSDGAGGVIVAWQDQRNGSSDLYAQRVGRAGRLIPAPGDLVAGSRPEPALTK
ncbi:MAG TPA: hypothetical protein VL123_03920 [Candidatus Udaeobacter sp.]|jgi:hypothetical protein|nr:hypothetical protein [Candidatus Udaeobacter sp.]